MNKAFFFQTKQISDDTILFKQFQQQKISFSYFQVDQKYYLFLYAQKFIDINFLYQSIDVIQESEAKRRLRSKDSKQRKIRSLRGFFLYALEIMVKPWFQEKILKSYLQISNLLTSFTWDLLRNGQKYYSTKQKISFTRIFIWIPRFNCCHRARKGF